MANSIRVTVDLTLLCRRLSVSEVTLFKDADVDAFLTTSGWVRVAGGVYECTEEGLGQLKPEEILRVERIVPSGR